MLRSLIRLLAGAAFVPAVAGAQLAGETVRVSYLFPDAATTYDVANVVVGPGVELNGFPTGDPRTNIDLSNSNILITYNSAGTWNSVPFNGLQFFDVFSSIAPITSVTLAGATNMAGLDASRISFDADNIFVNWQGLSFDEHTVVSLDINGAVSAVPEPATVALMASGLLGVGIAARRRRRAV